MERERPSRIPGRGAGGRGTTLHPERRARTQSRGYPRPDSRQANANPAQYAPPERKIPVTPTRTYPRTGGGFPSKRIRLSRKADKPSMAASKNVLLSERFRDVLWPGERELPAQNRTAFFVSLLYALIYTLCAALCVVPLNHLTARMPFPLAAAVRTFFPALSGAAFCTLTRLSFPDEPRLMLLAHGKLLWDALWIFLAVQALLWGEADAQMLIARFTLLFVAPPLAVGTAVSVLLLYWDWRNETDKGEDA